MKKWAIAAIILTVLSVSPPVSAQPGHLVGIALFTDSLMAVSDTQRILDGAASQVGGQVVPLDPARFDLLSQARHHGYSGWIHQIGIFPDYSVLAIGENVKFDSWGASTHLWLHSANRRAPCYALVVAVGFSRRDTAIRLGQSIAARINAFIGSGGSQCPRSF